MPVTNQDRNRIRRLHRRLDAELREKLRETYANAPPNEPVAPPNVIVAQNVLRIAMEVVIDESTPFDLSFCGELAIRLATYAISAAPIEDQARLVESVQKSLPAALERYVREGFALRTDWVHPGSDQPSPNVPDKKDID